MALSHENKISFRTASEVAEGVRLAVLKLRARGIKFNGRALGIESVMGAAALEFLSRTADEQAEILSRRIPQIEAALRGEPIGIAEPSIQSSVKMRQKADRREKA